MKTVLVPLAPGFEEIEAITVIDILRRAGVAVTVAGTQPGVIVASRGTKHVPDCLLDEVLTKEFDMLVLPGGLPGTTNLMGDARIRQLVETRHQRRQWLAAICAAPTILGAYGVLKDRMATGHPSTRVELRDMVGGLSDEPVVIDQTVVTSQAAGTAMEFAFRLVEILCGGAKVAEVNQGVLARLP